ncbi:MAG: hypothetical protein QM784_27600 [Polyangiaceae bacterium]
MLVDHMDDVLREALTWPDGDLRLGSRRLVLEYRSGELYEGETAGRKPAEALSVRPGAEGIPSTPSPSPVSSTPATN